MILVVFFLVVFLRWPSFCEIINIWIVYIEKSIVVNQLQLLMIQKFDDSLLSLIKKFSVEMKNWLVLWLCVPGSTHYSLFQCSWNLQLFQLLLDTQRLYSFILLITYLSCLILSFNWWMVIFLYQGTKHLLLYWFQYYTLFIVFIRIFYCKSERNCFKQLYYFIIINFNSSRMVGIK